MTYSNVVRRLALFGLLLIQTVAPALHAQAGADLAAPVVKLAAAEPEGGEAGDTTASGNLDVPDSHRLALLKMKGHLGVARSLLQVRAPGAEFHLQEPVQSIYRSIESELQGRNAPLTADILVQLERATEATPQAALSMLDSAAAAIDGSFAQYGALNAQSALSLSEALLREAVDLYANSVVENEVVDLQSYQTGRGLVIQAEALVRHSTRLKAKPGHDALLATVVLIRQAWPGVVPPPIVFDPESVAGRLKEAVAVMDELR